MKLKRTLFFALGIILFGCSKKSEDKVTINQSRKNSGNSFKQIQFKLNSSSGPVKLIELNSSQCEEMGLCGGQIIGLDTIYYRKYYNFKKLGGVHNLVTVYTFGDDYMDITLFTRDANNNVVDSYELAGEVGAGPGALKRESVMLNENEFLVMKISEFSDDTVNWVVSRVDTTKWTIKISKDHKIIGKRAPL